MLEEIDEFIDGSADRVRGRGMALIMLLSASLWAAIGMAVRQLF